MRREDVVGLDELGVKAGHIALIFEYTQNL